MEFINAFAHIFLLSHITMHFLHIRAVIIIFLFQIIEVAKRTYNLDSSPVVSRLLVINIVDFLKSKLFFHCNFNHFLFSLKLKIQTLVGIVGHSHLTDTKD